jgi:hypothetical protein
MKMLLIAAASAALLSPAIASAQDLSGTWKLDLSIAGMDYHAECKMAQAAMALSGNCSGGEGQGAVAMTGTVDGTTAKFAYDITYQGNPMHVAYTGNVTSDTAMDGSVDVQIAQGTFKAMKE